MLASGKQPPASVTQKNPVVFGENFIVSVGQTESSMEAAHKTTIICYNVILQRAVKSIVEIICII